MLHLKLVILGLLLSSSVLAEEEQQIEEVEVEIESDIDTSSDPVLSKKYKQIQTADKWFKEFDEFDNVYPLGDGITAEQATQFKKEWEEEHNQTSLLALTHVYLFGNDEIEPNLPLAIEYVTEGVKLGIPRSHALMGFLVATGRIPGEREEDPSELMSRAVIHYKFAEIADDRLGIAVMAYKARYGRGIPRSCRLASELYSVLSEQMALNQPDEMYFDFPGPFIDLSKQVLWSTPKEYTPKLYLQHLEAVGRTGNADILAEYGKYYMLTGTGEQDYEKAFSILSEAAEAGSADAKAHLGYLYQHGLGVNRDVNEALRLYKEASAKNSTVGLTLMGRLYVRGHDPIKQDVKKGVGFLEKAIAIPKKNHAMARLELGDVYRNGLGDVPQDKMLALDHYSKATFGSKAALHEVGMMQIDDNCEFAVVALKSAAEFGITFADIMDQADKFFVKGEFAKALYRFELAAEMGNEVAQTNAAFMYLYDFADDEPLSTEKNDATIEITDENKEEKVEEKVEKEEEKLESINEEEKEVKQVENVEEKDVEKVAEKEEKEEEEIVIVEKEEDKEEEEEKMEEKAEVTENIKEEEQKNEEKEENKEEGEKVTEKVEEKTEVNENLKEEEKETITKSDNENEEYKRMEKERLSRKYKYAFYYYKARAQQDMTNSNMGILTDSTKDVLQGDSFVRLGDMFYYGNGVKQNYTIAAGFYNQVANRNSQAAFNLGYMYQFGIGVPQDLYMAKRMYDNSNKLVQNRLATWPALITVFVMHCYSYSMNNPDVAFMGLLCFLLLPLLYYRHFRDMKYIRVTHVVEPERVDRDEDNENDE